MELREQLAIAICGAPEYTLPPLYSADNAPIQLLTRCVCARDGRIPTPTIVRCATCLSKADAVINLLVTANLI